ncbi:hypothetical protein BU26DRAFT_501201 [Trematosphaeria pertusa]|uniref:Uncharacterized protein n=1 Tax=Trematosphaeria pertusa TaxID=390896 RepID=A0A6A6IS66_9PLEO|nr:uncharacterized protein BU26DRAFT_501201 [Trematosphaeria pertusa]KAF2252918.1 hypothetical protein BU26DRAFT_501201 [Trematosphaeria pertusa]
MRPSVLTLATLLSASYALPQEEAEIQYTPRDYSGTLEDRDLLVSRACCNYKKCTYFEDRPNFHCPKKHPKECGGDLSSIICCHCVAEAKRTLEAMLGNEPSVTRNNYYYRQPQIQTRRSPTMKRGSGNKRAMGKKPT